MSTPQNPRRDLLARQLADAFMEGAALMHECLTGKSTPVNRDIATEAAMDGLASTYRKIAHDLLEALDALAQKDGSTAQ